MSGLALVFYALAFMSLFEALGFYWFFFARFRDWPEVRGTVVAHKPARRARCRTVRYTGTDGAVREGEAGPAQYMPQADGAPVTLKQDPNDPSRVTAGYPNWMVALLMIGALIGGIVMFFWGLSLPAEGADGLVN